MSLCPPFSTATTLASLEAAGITIVQEDAGWFIKTHQQIAGPYATAEAALEASTGWLPPSAKQVGASGASYQD